MQSKLVQEKHILAVTRLKIWKKRKYKKLEHVFKIRLKIFNLEKNLVWMTIFLENWCFILGYFFLLSKSMKLFLHFQSQFKKKVWYAPQVFFRFWKYRFSTLTPYSSDIYWPLLPPENVTRKLNRLWGFSPYLTPYKVVIANIISFRIDNHVCEMIFRINV